MKQKINVLIISIIAVTILVVSFIFAINHRKETINYFYDSGYIISNKYEDDSNNVNKLYFENEGSYKKGKNDTYTFTNSEGERVNVSEESFVHYSNGSIMSLKKGVAIDLNNIDSKLISYYNIFEGSVLTKKNEIYEIKNLNDTVSFSKLMFKLSSNKYLIGAKKIIISFSDDQTVEMEDYVEIEYVDENVIRIYNDNVNYQTIASNLYLLIDNIKIDLEYKTISKNDIEYLTMADMVINSDDNIEILPEKPEIIIKEENENNITNNNDHSNNNAGTNNEGNNNTGGEINSDLEEGLENLITNLPESNEQVEEEKEIVQPKFNVNSMDVTTLGFENLSISFEDESAILYGNRTVQILENSTGKVINTFKEWEEGTSEYKIDSYLLLKPNTAYTLNVVGQYKIDDVVYDRIFISKIFRTLDTGLEITNDCITDDTLSFAVYKNSYSEVNGFGYNISDKEGNVIVEVDNVKFNETNKLIITNEKKFKPNTEYILSINKIQYGNEIFINVSTEQLKIEHKVKTLKKNPFKISENIELKGFVDVDKRTVEFSVKGINDINGGIKDYTYNIYDLSGNKINTITKNDSNPLTLSFEELQNVDALYFNVSINFDDNEKTIIYTSNRCEEAISLTGISYPKVVSYKEDTDNKDGTILKGSILIDDKDEFLKKNQITEELEYLIEIRENSKSPIEMVEKKIGSIKITTSNENGIRYSLPIYFDDLVPKTEYIFYVYLLHNDSYIYLGYDTTTTYESEPIYLNINNVPSDSEELFDIEVIREVEKSSISLDYLKYIKFDLYRISNSKEDAEWEKTNYTATIPRTQDSQELNQLIEKNEKININSASFGFYLNEYLSEYNYKIVVTGHSNKFEIPIKINNSDTNELEINFNNIDPYLSIVAKDKIMNRDSNEINNNLDSDTIVGINFEVQTTENPLRQKINKVFYSIFEADSYDEKLETCKPKNGEELSEALITKEITDLNEYGYKTEYLSFPFENKIFRGKHYCMVYYGSYINEANEEIETSSKTLHFIAEKQRAKIKGYVKKYDGLNLILDLEKNDPDNALGEGSFTLENNFGSISPTIENNIYTYKILGDTQYNLEINENIGYGNNQYIIDKINLDNIIILPEINIEGISEPGKIILKIPYGEEETLKENILSRVAGLELKDKNGNSHLYKLINNDTYLYTEINLDSIKEYGYGDIKENKLEFKEIKLLYDSGKVNKDSNSLFIKSKEYGYFDKIKNNFYNDSSIQHIYKKSDLIYDDNTEIYKITGSKEKTFLKLNSFISNKEDYIGLYLNSENSLPKLIDFNEVIRASLNLTNSIEVKDVITTSSFETVYTRTGANVSFDIKTKEISNNTKLIIELNDGEKREINYSESGWDSFTGAVSDKISNISVSANRVTVKFRELSSDFNYLYSVKFKIDDSEEYTYNNETKQTNKDISISSLEKLVYKKTSADAKSEYWKWINEKSKLEFKKYIDYSIEIDTSKYLLQNDEKIVYKLLARDNDGNITYLIGDENNSTELTQVINGKINLFNKTLNGKYEIILKPFLIYNNENSLIELDEKKLGIVDITNFPIDINVLNTGNRIFSISMNDKDGLFTKCEDFNPQGSIIKYLDDDVQNYYDNGGRQVAYLYLYKTNENNENDYIGYLPIPFNYKTVDLDLAEYFDDNNLTGGKYGVKILYCENGEQKTYEKNDIIINETININLITLPESYVIILHNPVKLKDEIMRIEYQYQTDNGTYVKSLDNTDTNETNNIVYTTNIREDGSVDEFIGLSIDNIPTYKIKSFTVSFYDGNGKVIEKYSKH